MPRKRRGESERDADSASTQAGETTTTLLTPAQIRFIEELLTGKMIKTAAALSGVSERTATYWLADKTHPVTVEYQKRRVQALAAVDQRVAQLHERAFQAIESLLSEETPPFIRIQAVKMLWDNSLKEMCVPKQPRSPSTLAEQSASRYFEDERRQGSINVALWDTRNRKRLND